MLAKQGLKKNLLDGRKQLGCAGKQQGQEDLRPTEPREEQNTQKRVEGSSAQAGPPACLCVLSPEGHRTQGGLSSLHNSTHIRFPGLLCFCFNPQIYDFKGFKQEGLLIRKGMTRELKVSAWAPGAWGQSSMMKRWPASSLLSTGTCWHL